MWDIWKRSMDGRRKCSKAVDLFFLEFQRGMKIVFKRDFQIGVSQNFFSGCPRLPFCFFVPKFISEIVIDILDEYGEGEVVQYIQTKLLRVYDFSFPGFI